MYKGTEPGFKPRSVATKPCRLGTQPSLACAHTPHETSRCLPTAPAHPDLRTNHSLIPSACN